MSVVAADLVAYAAASMPTDDVSTSGGAIDPLRRVSFTDLAANDDVEVISSSAGDTQNCTIVARLASGVIVTETLALTGVTAKIFAGNGVVQRIESVELASAAIGTITVRRSVAGATISTIPIGERGFMRLFRNSKSSPAGALDYYEKFFWKNTNATFALLNAAVAQSVDPSGKVTHLLSSAVNDSGSVANRLTAPAAGITLDPDTFGDAAVTIPGTDLAPGSAIGVWLKLALVTADSPQDTTYTTLISGDTT